MNEQDIYISNLDEYIKANDFDNFDKAVINAYFSEKIDLSAIDNFRTDKYGDAGIDYIFFLINNHNTLEFDEVEEFIDSDDNQLDIYFIQTKESKKLDSNVINKFIEFSMNLKSCQTREHYNEQINDNIILYKDIITKYLFKIKINLHYYYFSKVTDRKIADATDLAGRKKSLISLFSDIDYISHIDVNIISIQDVLKKVNNNNNFKYKFENVEKFEVQIDQDNNTANSLIALVPISELYNFLIYNNDGKINDKLFEKNIRDFKGRSSVNKNITASLQKDFNESNKIDFWWLNNGITITVEDLNESQSMKKFEVINPQIVNGLQTSYAIYNYYSQNLSKLDKEKRKVFVKIIKISEDMQANELDIIVATNSQNEIRDKDIHANDEVQKRIEMYFLEKEKYYQRKDKYYTNRKFPKKDIIKITELAKYINTIYLHNPSSTRNNPGKLLNGKKYEEIFQIRNPDQNYERYNKVVELYNKVMLFSKNTIKINNDYFDTSNFIHHIVYIVTILLTNNLNYGETDIAEVSVESINSELIEKAENILIDLFNEKSISNAKILKIIKEQNFMQNLNKKLQQVISRA